MSTGVTDFSLDAGASRRRAFAALDVANFAQKARNANWLALYWSKYNQGIADYYQRRRDTHIAAARDAQIRSK